LSGGDADFEGAFRDLIARVQPITTGVVRSALAAGSRRLATSAPIPLIECTSAFDDGRWAEAGGGWRLSFWRRGISIDLEVTPVSRRSCHVRGRTWPVRSVAGLVVTTGTVVPFRVDEHSRFACRDVPRSPFTVHIELGGAESPDCLTTDWACL
jgi:hypothetical protein